MTECPFCGPVLPPAQLRTQSFSGSKIGAVGFCFGGGVTYQLAVRMGPDLAVGVPFYGGQPNAADVAKIKPPIQAHYGELDERVNAGAPAYHRALTAAGATAVCVPNGVSFVAESVRGRASCEVRPFQQPSGV